MNVNLNSIDFSNYYYSANRITTVAAMTIRPDHKIVAVYSGATSDPTETYNLETLGLRTAFIFTIDAESGMLQSETVTKLNIDGSDGSNAIRNYIMYGKGMKYDSDNNIVMVFDQLISAGDKDSAEA